MTSLETRFLNAKRACFEKLYSKLNSKQRQAVFTVDGPLLVLAGAGSGKTTVLVHRIAHIIRYGKAYESDSIPEYLCDDEVEFLEDMAKGTIPLDPKSLVRYAEESVPPYAVLAITFTNKAANSMKQKLAAILSEEEAKDIWAGTFHSICAKLLRREIQNLGYDRSFAIYDTDDTKKLLTECIKELDLSTERFPVKPIQNIISNSKDKLVEPDDFAREAGSDFYLSRVAKIFTLYEEKLKKANALDFDDLIGKTVKLFSLFPDILEHYQRMFRYVLVDEYQDTNHAQFMLVSLLCARFRNLMVVGDDDQSIYSFRGATIDNILSFDKTYADAKVIKLEQNYRSSGSILGAANSLIAKNRGRFGKTLWCDGEQGQLPTVAKVDNQSAEVQYIADCISAGVASGRKFSDYAILYRLNAQSAGFETVFAKSGIPYRMLCGIRFYERAEVKDIVSYMQVCLNVKDDTRLKRIVNTPKRSIGDTTMEAVSQLAAAKGVSLFEIMEEAGSHTALERSAAKLEKFCAFIRSMQSCAAALPIGEFVEKLINESGYADMLIAKGDEGAERMENLKELVNNAALHCENNPEATLVSFLEEVSLIADIDNYDSEADAVTMMTVHSAKGLEFPSVFIPGMEEGIFPGALCVTEKDVEEERRLAYVALTRAEKELYVSYARERMMYGHTNFNRPSRFIKEIDESCKQTVDMSIRKSAESFGGYSRRSEFTSSFGGERDRGGFTPSYTVKAGAKPVTSAPKKEAVPLESFKAGDAVVHKMFGEGLVLSVTDMGGDTLYEVAFEKAGTKKLMATYAKLKRKG